MLFQCCVSVEDAKPTLKQHCVNVSCFLGYTASSTQKKLTLKLLGYFVVIY